MTTDNQQNEWKQIDNSEEEINENGNSFFDNLDNQQIEEKDRNNTKHEKTSSTFLNIDDIQKGFDEDVKIIDKRTPIEDPIESEVEEDSFDGIDEIKSEKKPRKKRYVLPSINLLDPLQADEAIDVNKNYAKEMGERLIAVLEMLNLPAVILDTQFGLYSITYVLRFDPKVRISSIKQSMYDIKMQLGIYDIRIEAPIPGHNAVGIEIPNVKTSPVKMQELVRNVIDTKSPLLICLGKDVLGQTITGRIDKMPHLLIAGATGSGKSVFINSIITSILLRAKPDEVKMLLIDPKKVEFTPYKRLPHLIGPVIDDAAKASNALKVVVKEMEDRFEIFSRNGVRTIQAYNENVDNGNITREDAEGNQYPADKLPYIVIIIDELADLMMVARTEVETSIHRILQSGRATGIHLVVATNLLNDPDINNLIGLFPSLVVFQLKLGKTKNRLLSHFDETLYDTGEMFYAPFGETRALRVQGAFVTDDEIRRIADYCSNQAVPVYYDAFVDLAAVYRGGEAGYATSEDDPLYEEIKDYVIEAQKAKTDLLQRKFGIGYNRAARMIDILESEGIIGPAQGSKPREVYIKKREEE